MKPLIIGFFMDLMLGDPHGWYHPVRTIGRLINKSEELLRKIFPSTPKGEMAGGILFAALIPGIGTGISWLLLKIAAKAGGFFRLAAESVMCYQLLAAKSLKDESMKVYDELKKGDTEKARKAVSMIVGRDTQCLSREGITKAAVETVAENTSDGVIAPLLFMAFGGAPAGFFYKSVNTMDSMVGYRNEKYEYFGKAAAKLDDMVNWVPARISGLLMVACAFLLGKKRGFDGKNAWKIYLRDRKNHKSPNSAQTEAACAGALQVKLAGDAWYFGKLVKKPTLGDDIRNIEPEDIPRANRLMYMTAWLALFGAAAIKMHRFLTPDDGGAKR